MANKTVAERVTSVITDQLADYGQVAVAEVNITAETNMETDLQFDSLDNVEIVMRLEEEFGMALPDEDFIDCKTVGEVITIMQKVTGKE